MLLYCRPRSSALSIAAFLEAPSSGYYNFWKSFQLKLAWQQITNQDFLHNLIFFKKFVSLVKALTLTISYFLELLNRKRFICSK